MPLFDFVCEVSLNDDCDPCISWKHHEIQEDDRLKSMTQNIPKFCFPDVDSVKPVREMEPETYCFVFRDSPVENMFGFCRRFLPATESGSPQKRFPVVYCMITQLRCFETFSKIFDQVVKLRSISDVAAQSFLKALSKQNAPKLGHSITVSYLNAELGDLDGFTIERLAAPKRFEHVNLADLLKKLGSTLLVEIFINLLAERNVLFVAESLNELTTTMHSIMQLLHPLHWQCTYIPVLPQDAMYVTSSPIPFAIGILNQHAKALKEKGSCNLVKISKKQFSKQRNSAHIPVKKELRENLKQELKQYKGKMSESGQTPEQQTVEIGGIFCQFIKALIGHYTDHVTFNAAGQPEINNESFIKAAEEHADFVWELSRTQMFGSFIHGLTQESTNEDVFHAR